MDVAQNKWTSILSGKSRQKATSIAIEVAQRCASQQNIARAFISEATKPKHWAAASVAGGNAGLVLLYAYLHGCFPNDGWERIAHEHLEQAVELYEPRHRNLSLFTGASGIGFVAHMASQDGAQYKSLRAGVNAHIAQHLPLLVRHIEKNGPRVRSFDLIQGVSGIVTYLLTLPAELLSAYNLNKSLDVSLQYLISLAEPHPTTGFYCFISPQHVHRNDRAEKYPYGYSDTGLAHGASSVIGALALALKKGHDIPGLEEGLHRLAYWLISQEVEDTYGINWPTFLAPDVPATEGYSSRAAWCYGIPGTARVLFLAGSILNDNRLRQTGIDAMQSLMKRPRKLWHAIAPNLCHGYSGILQSSLRMYHDTQAPEFKPFINQLVHITLSFYDPATLFGFRDRYQGRDWYDNPRLLNGAPGVALALLAASQPVDPSWDRLFLLS